MTRINNTDELKEFALSTMENLKGYKHSEEYIKGQMAGLFKMWRTLNGLPSKEYDKYLEVFEEVLDQI